jgi:rhamnogalacturonyl hydrolase YesR
MQRNQKLVIVLSCLLFFCGSALLNESRDTLYRVADKYLNNSYPFRDVSNDSYQAIIRGTTALLSDPPPEPDYYYGHHLQTVADLKSLIKKRSGNLNNAFNAALAFGLWEHHHGTRQDVLVIGDFCNRIVSDNGLKSPINSIDQTMIGYVLLALYDQTKEIRYRRAVAQIFDFLSRSTNGSCSRTIPYRESSPDTMFIDTLGMICPFLSYYGTLFNEPKATEMAIHQLKAFISRGLDEDTMLPYHAYNASSDGPGFGILGWTRGTGWLLLGLIGTLEHLSREHPDYPIISDAFHKILNAVLKYQKTDGTFGWALSIPQSETDTSGTAMIGYAIEKGMALGILHASYASFSQKAMRGILRHTKKNGMIDQALVDVQGVGLYPRYFDVNCWGQGFSMAFYALLYNRSMH